MRASAESAARVIRHSSVEEQHDFGTEGKITSEHVKNNEEVRKLLRDRGIVPERLPPAEDVKKVERLLKSEEKKLLKATDEFNLPHD